MQSVVLDIEDMSDSQELYLANPNKAISIFIYIVVLMVFAMSVWLYCGRIDIVVHTEGQITFNKMEKQFKINLYVNNSEIGEIKEGMEVKGDVYAYPAAKYGHIEGVITNISVATAQEKERVQGKYRVEASLKQQTLDDKNGEKVKLKEGMECRAKVIIENKRSLDYFLEKIGIR